MDTHPLSETTHGGLGPAPKAACSAARATASRPPLPAARVIVCSDRAHSGSYPDKAGPAAWQWLAEHGYLVTEPVAVVADEASSLIASLTCALSAATDLVVVSGGTGLGPRDITPQTLDGFCDYAIAGFGELLRRESLKYSLNAYLSRCGGWVKDRSLILALPGNPKAVVEQLEIIATLLPHALTALAGSCQDRRATGLSPHDGDATP